MLCCYHIKTLGVMHTAVSSKSVSADFSSVFESMSSLDRPELFTYLTLPHSIVKGIYRYLLAVPTQLYSHSVVDGLTFSFTKFLLTVTHCIMIYGKQVLMYPKIMMAHCSKAVLYKVLNLAVQTRLLSVKVSTIYLLSVIHFISSLFYELEMSI